MFRRKVSTLAFIAFITALIITAQTPQDAEAHQNSGDWSSAESVWRKLALQHPADYRLWTSLGISLAHQDKYDDAIAAYKKALALKPHDAQTELNLGIAYFKSAKLPEAVPPLRVAASGLPNNPQVHLLLGMSLYGTGQYREAAANLEKVGANDAQNPALARILVDSYLQDGEYDKALAEVNQMLIRDPDAPEVHVLLGEEYDATNHPDEAIEEFRKATAQRYVPTAYFGLGYLLWKNHRYDEAIVAFQKELQNDPQSAQSLAYLGDTFLKRGDKPQAERLLRQSVAIRGDIRIDYFDLGVIDSEAGHNQAAEKEFKRCIDLDPSQPDAHYRLARIYQATERSGEAQKQFAIVKQLHERTSEDLLLKVNGSPKSESH